ncbi:hypothetical protein ACFY3G_17850 [Streptomyces phaeochromogenes]|uniref:hypothetical protein n=1 Tax=Streptomyces phaeochromogenes TaxID=1923 RepID=UPI0036AA3AC3
MPFDLGKTVRLTAQCRDAGGTLTTASAAVLTITQPDGTTAAPAVPAPGSAGEYVVDWLPTMAGLHQLRWTFTTPSDAYTDALDVRPAQPLTMFSLRDAKRQVGIPLDVTREDDELRDEAASATRAVEFFVGAVVRRTVTSVCQGGGPLLLVPETPVIAVTAIEPVTSVQQDVDAGVLVPDPVTGVVHRSDGLGFPPGAYRLTYTAGRVVVSRNISRAGELILQHLWRTRRGGSRTTTGGGEDYLVTEPIPGLGYAIPNRALQLLQADAEPEGFA